jgi:hypothetical protein
MAHLPWEIERSNSTMLAKPAVGLPWCQAEASHCHAAHSPPEAIRRGLAAHVCKHLPPLAFMLQSCATRDLGATNPLRRILPANWHYTHNRPACRRAIFMVSISPCAKLILAQLFEHQGHQLRSSRETGSSTLQIRKGFLQDNNEAHRRWRLQWSEMHSRWEL